MKGEMPMSTINNKTMIKEQIIARNITNKNVIEAMLSVDRELFVDQAWRHSSYTDSPLPIACGQTISQPYIVAFMTEAAQLDKETKILEIGTGSNVKNYNKIIYSITAIAICILSVVIILRTIPYFYAPQTITRQYVYYQMQQRPNLY